MEPARHSRLPMRDRARRIPLRPISLPSQAIKPDIRLVPSSAKPEPTTAIPAPQPQPNRTARVLLVSIFAMTGVSFGGLVGLVGWPMLQAAGVVAPPVIETVQRKQAAMISELETTVSSLNSAVTSMGVRVETITARQDIVNRQVHELDAKLGGLRTSVDELRAQQSAAREAWREPVAELSAATAKTRSEMGRLKSTVDDLARARSSEQSQRALLGQMRSSIRDAVATDGHIINLPAAQ